EVSVYATSERQVDVEGDDRGIEIAAAKLNDLGDHVAEINERGRAGLLAAESRQVADDLARAPRLRLDERHLVEQIGAELLVALEQFRRPENRLQRIIQLVRHAGGGQPDGREAL